MPIDTNANGAAELRPLTVKQERFAVGVTQGLSLTDAYAGAFDVKAGRKPANVGKDASRLAKLPHVKARIAALKKRVRRKVEKLLVKQAAASLVTPEDAAVEPVLRSTAVDVAGLIVENARIGFSDIRRVLGPDGRLKPSEEWDADTAAAVSSIKVRELFGEGKDGVGVIGQAVEIKMWDKGAALDRLGRHLGLYDKDNTQKAPSVFEGLPRDQLKVILEALGRMRK